MRLLAIDPATSCGWCVMDDDHIESGVWNLSERADTSPYLRPIRLRTKLSEMHRHKNIDFLAYEYSCNLRGNAIRVIGQLHTVISIWAIDNQVAFKGYAPMEIKKHATGKGNCNKAAMQIAAHHRWPEIHRMGPSDWPSDEADARWLADLAAQQFFPVAVEGGREN